MTENINGFKAAVAAVLGCLTARLRATPARGCGTREGVLQSY